MCDEVTLEQLQRDVLAKHVAINVYRKESKEKLKEMACDLELAQSLLRIKQKMLREEHTCQTNTIPA